MLLLCFYALIMSLESLASVFISQKKNKVDLLEVLSTHRLSS